MRILRSLCIAFSTYSKIPMPIFEWKQEDMRYTLLFFPWVGAVIGAILYGWVCLCNWLAIGELARCIGMALIPVLITGGFHVDGYMDTMDALHSYQSKEKKLEILKDPHIGAFSVIWLGVLGLIYVAGCSEIYKMESVIVLACSFMMTRIFSGLSLVYFKAAKQNGSLYIVAEAASRGRIRVGLIVLSVLLFAFMALFAWKQALISLICIVAAFCYYRYRSYKEFGGITGDLAGWFVCVSECMVVAGLAVSEIG